MDSQQTTSADVPAAIVNGEALRELRESIRQSQSQFARLIGITKSRLGQIEYKNQTVAPTIQAAAIALARAVRNSTVKLAETPRVSDWHQNRKFNQIPPFENRPVCPCGADGCVLRPHRDGDWPIEGHLWCFTGSHCTRLRYVNSRGALVRPIRKNGTPGRPTHICKRCGRAMQASTKYSSNLGCKITVLRCRRKPGDSRDLKHDEPRYFRSEKGRFRALTPSELDKLHGRTGRSFPSPKCELAGCPRHGKTMERSGIRLAEIVAFACRGTERHYEFRHDPGGERVSKLADGWYQWTDAKTAERKELHMRPGGEFERRPHRHPAPPDVFCPDHPANTLQRCSGPWFDPRNRKLRWQYQPCPSDQDGHPGWTCSRGEDPRIVVPRPKRRWEALKGGRPRGKISEDTRRRIRLAAAFSQCGISARKMSVHLFPDKPESAEPNTYKFFQRYRQEIERVKADLTDSEARAQVAEFTP